MNDLENKDLLLAIITVTVLFFLFSAFTISYFFINQRKRRLHRKQLEESKKEYERQLSLAQIEVQEWTYKHMAQELHDNIGQLLSTTKMLINVAELKLADIPQPLTSAQETLSNAIQQLRLISRSLDSEWLQQFNFLENLETEINRINTAKIVTASIQQSTRLEIPSDKQILLFRIVQEAMHNALRHAAPTSLTVQISRREGFLIEVVNNGLPLPDSFHGMGTTNMRKRAALFDGEIAWKSADGLTIVTVKMPFENESAPN